MAKPIKHKKRKVYRFLRNGNIMAEGTVEEIAQATGKTLTSLYQNAYRTRQGLNNTDEEVIEYGRYEPVYDFTRKGVLEATGTMEELADALFLAQETIRHYASQKEVGDVKVKYKKTVLIKTGRFR